MSTTLRPSPKTWPQGHDCLEDLTSLDPRTKGNASGVGQGSDAVAEISRGGAQLRQTLSFFRDCSHTDEYTG